MILTTSVISTKILLTALGLAGACLVPVARRLSGPIMMAVKVAFFGCIFVILSSIAYDTHMYHHLFNVDEMASFGVMWGWIDLAVDSYFQVLGLYFIIGALLVFSVYYLHRRASECDAMVYMTLTLPGCLVEYSGLLRQGVAVGCFIMSLALLLERRWFWAGVCGVLAVAGHTSVVAAYLLVGAAAVLSSGLKSVHKFTMVVFLAALLYVADVILGVLNYDPILPRIGGYIDVYLRDKSIQGDFGFKLALMWVVCAAIGFFAVGNNYVVVLGRTICIWVFVLYPLLVSFSGLAVRIVWYVLPLMLPAVLSGLSRLTGLPKHAQYLLIALAFAAFAYYVALMAQSEFVPIRIPI